MSKGRKSVKITRSKGANSRRRVGNEKQEIKKLTIPLQGSSKLTKEDIENATK